jgi:hypothetical protein
MDTDFEPLHKPIAYTVQFALDKVRPPVKPGVSYGAILKNVSVVRVLYFQIRSPVPIPIAASTPRALTCLVRLFGM